MVEVMLLTVLELLLVTARTSALFEPTYEISNPTDGALHTLREQTVYFPLGQHAVLPCAALDELLGNGFSVTNLKWLMKGCTFKVAVNINSVNNNSRFDYNDSSLVLYTVQKEHEGPYDCHALAHDKSEWVSRVNLVVQDCDNSNELSSFRNLLNPCRFGECVVKPMFDEPEEDGYVPTSNVSYVACNCVTQFTGPFCDVVVEGAVMRELSKFTPFACHMLSLFSMVLLFFGRYYFRSSTPQISLVDVVPKPAVVADNPQILYPAIFEVFPEPAVPEEKPSVDEESKGEPETTPSVMRTKPSVPSKKVSKPSVASKKVGSKSSALSTNIGPSIVAANENAAVVD